jgi:uncharacterized coiled-coil protein SlyX
MIPLPFSDGERRSMKEAFQREYDARVAADATIDTLSAELAATREERDRLQAAVDQLVAHSSFDSWSTADGSEVGVPEGTIIFSGIAALDASQKEN